MNITLIELNWTGDREFNYSQNFDDMNQAVKDLAQLPDYCKAFIKVSINDTMHFIINKANWNKS